MELNKMNNDSMRQIIDLIKIIRKNHRSLDIDHAKNSVDEIIFELGQLRQELEHFQMEKEIVKVATKDGYYLSETKCNFLLVSLPDFVECQFTYYHNREKQDGWVQLFDYHPEPCQLYDQSVVYFYYLPAKSMPSGKFISINSMGQIITSIDQSKVDVVPFIYRSD